MRAIHALVASLPILLWSASAGAQNIGFLKDAPVSFMTREDQALLSRNYVQALDELPDGHTNTWTNPATGHSGTATPLKTMKQGGTTCRLIEITNRAGGQTGRSEWTFCRTKDGWRSSGR